MGLNAQMCPVCVCAYIYTHIYMWQRNGRKHGDTEQDAAKSLTKT